MSVQARNSSNQHMPVVDGIGYFELLAETRLAPGDSPSHDHYYPYAQAAAERDMPYDYLPNGAHRRPAQFFEYPGGHNFYAEIVTAADAEAFGIGETAVHGGEAAMAEVTVLTLAVADAQTRDLAA